MIEPFDFDLFLSDDLHVFANFRHDILDHAAGAVDFKLDRHRLLHGIGHPAAGRIYVAAKVSSENQKGQCTDSDP